MTDLNAAKKQYSTFLSRRATAMKRHAQMTNRCTILEMEIPGLVEELERLSVKRDEMFPACAAGDLPESELDSLEAEIAKAKGLIERKREMLALTQKELSSNPVPAVSDGKKDLETLGDAACFDLLEKKKKELDTTRLILAQAYARWAYLGGDWEEFLQEVFPAPEASDNEKEREIFVSNILSPLESVAQKEFSDA